MERDFISTRTKAALAAAARAKTIAPTIISMRESGSTWEKIAKQLNAMSVPTARGGKWYGKTVLNAANSLWDEKLFANSFIGWQSGFVTYGNHAMLRHLTGHTEDPLYGSSVPDDAWDDELRAFYGLSSGKYVLKINPFEPWLGNSMIIALKPCVACNKDYNAKLLHDGVCEKCLAAVVIKKWLRADG